MELARQESVTRPAILSSNGSIELAEDDKIRIQTKPKGGEWTDLLDEQVPSRMEWDVQIVISIEEVEKE
jgi:hypothetical protein